MSVRIVYSDFSIRAGIFLALSFFSQSGWSQVSDSTTVLSPSEVSTVTIEADKGSDRLKKEEVNRVESIQKKDLVNKQAQTFSQLIDDEKGIDSQTACAFCGAKRISINGLKGEHTTILVDGLSLHSTVSGFYGVEAIPLEGIDSIDIYRGSGTALTAPESIGGALNIVTKEIVENQAQGTIRWADRTQKNISLLGTRKLTPETGFLLGVQAGESSPYDYDSNRISEVPSQKTQSVVTKLTSKITASTEVSARISHANLKTFGGSMQNPVITSPSKDQPSSEDFVGNDVRNRFLGTEEQITDNVTVERTEAALISLTNLDETSSVKLAVGAAWQKQEALYSHGYDYNNQDQIVLGQIEYQKILNADHLLTFGADSKKQVMTSDSVVLYQELGLRKDNLDYNSLGFYIQDTWLLNDQDEISLVLRHDRLQTQWTELDKEVSENLWAPRLFYKHLHDGTWTSRVSAGLGYRAPLTLFESQHGTDHNGFEIEIDKLETAQSFTYSLAGQRLDDFFEFGAHLTNIENMAYGEDRAETDQPTLFKNSDESYLVTVFDLSYGRRLTERWTVEAIFEAFNYPSGYKAKLPVAALERRLTLTSDFTFGKWNANQKLIIVGERDLSAYGYGQHYNIAAVNDDIFDPNFGQTVVAGQKMQKAPTYFTLDVSVHRNLAPSWDFAVSILNVFDYTQSSAGDTPTTWDLHGNHFHLDNFHIWGPLRGRQVYFSISAQL